MQYYYRYHRVPVTPLLIQWATTYLNTRCIVLEHRVLIGDSFLQQYLALYSLLHHDRYRCDRSTSSFSPQLGCWWSHSGRYWKLSKIDDLRICMSCTNSSNIMLSHCLLYTANSGNLFNYVLHKKGFETVQMDQYCTPTTLLLSIYTPLGRLLCGPSTWKVARRGGGVAHCMWLPMSDRDPAPPSSRPG